MTHTAADEPQFFDPGVGAALDTLSPTESPNLTLAFARQRTLQVQRGRAWPHHRPWSFLMSMLTQQLSFVRQPVRALAAMAVLLFALSFLTSPMQSLASQFLTIFRVQDFTPVTVSRSLAGIPDLMQFGEMEPGAPPRLQPQQVASLGAASSAVGFTVKTPSSLPAGVQSQPKQIAVTPEQNVSFTFRADRARAYLASINRSDVTLPARFDGATLQVHVPAAAMLTFAPPEAVGSATSEVRRGALNDAALSSVIMVQAKSPTVEASGVSLEELRDFLLSLPGLPAETAAQLRAIGNLGTTLPVPVPSDRSARKIQIDGAPGLIYADPNSSLAGGLIWQRDGVVYALGGALNEAGLMSIATSVR
jgi:hypothetical protein